MEKIEVKVKGACCACQSEGPHRNLVTVKITAPEAGTGWGCIICGLEPNGAIAVLCDDCVEAQAVSITHVSLGRVNTGNRISIQDYRHEDFDHDMAVHEEYDQMQADLAEQQANSVEQLRRSRNGGSRHV